MELLSRKHLLAFPSTATSLQSEGLTDSMQGTNRLSVPTNHRGHTLLVSSPSVTTDRTSQPKSTAESSQIFPAVMSRPSAKHGTSEAARVVARELKALPVLHEHMMSNPSPLLIQNRTRDPERLIDQEHSIRHEHHEGRSATIKEIILAMISAFMFILTICLPYQDFSEPVFKALASFLTVLFMVIHQVTVAAPRDTMTATAAYACLIVELFAARAGNGNVP